MDGLFVERGRPLCPEIIEPVRTSGVDRDHHDQYSPIIMIMRTTIIRMMRSVVSIAVLIPLLVVSMLLFSSSHQHVIN